jgi:uncharacterized phiE125 gp8 family phage protein
VDLRIKTDAESEVLEAADIAGFLKYEDGDEDELALIDSMIKTARALFEQITGRSFVEKTYVVYFKHDNRPYILPLVPVISVDSVKEVDIDGTETTLTLNSDYYKKGLYEVELITDAMTALPNPFRTFAGKYDLQVEFKAGYGNSNTETLPEPLKQIIKMQVKQWYDNRDDFYELKILGSIQKILNTYKTMII